ncbi:unnamed protein product, partial [Alternaria alternata]
MDASSISLHVYISILGTIRTLIGPERLWEWEQSIGLISSDFHFFDGTGDSENCTSIKKIQWTYNAGVHISGAAAMWNV